MPVNTLHLPPRVDLLAWGLKPCKGRNCRVLVNTDVTGRGFCVRCSIDHNLNKRKKEQHHAR